MPIQLLEKWIKEEKDIGAPNPQQAILSTATKEGIPHSRVVAIREITPQGILFFTQKGTRKVTEIADNPRVSLAFWFELIQRSVILEAFIEALSEGENKAYWSAYPRIAQLRFLAYAPTSSQPIDSKQILEDKKSAIEQEYRDKELPYTPLYCGYRIIPQKFTFYQYRTDELSDVSQYVLQDGKWQKQIISP
ncbi:pyridoxal 5'-phosphate synthase [Legionella dresdenensis]|uniref:Pyridoxal 5'-phosphate synthase n=1 Tax=Legionella dresdenensis TaxID=450200 RepID=A0ABV8CBE4_9GAMM